jgi:hypothetical protein
MERTHNDNNSEGIVNTEDECANCNSESNQSYGNSLGAIFYNEDAICRSCIERKEGCSLMKMVADGVSEQKVKNPIQLDEWLYQRDCIIPSRDVEYNHSVRVDINNSSDSNR